MDDDDLHMLEATGDVLIFATTDNGDMCGWQLAELRDAHRTTEPSILAFQDFAEPRTIATSTGDLVNRIAAGENLFGIGALPATFRAHKS